MLEVVNSSSALTIDDFEPIEEGNDQTIEKTVFLVNVLKGQAKEEGLFRLSGDQEKVRLLGENNAKILAAGLGPSLKAKVISIHDVMGTLKQQIKEEPIFGSTLLSYLDREMETMSDDEVKRVIFDNLTPLQLTRLVKIVDLIREVQTYASLNKMTLSNINLAFGPTLLLPTDHPDAAKGALVRSGKETAEPLKIEDMALMAKVVQERGKKNLRLMELLVNHFS